MWRGSIRCVPLRGLFSMTRAEMKNAHVQMVALFLCDLGLVEHRDLSAVSLGDDGPCSYRKARRRHTIEETGNE